MAGPAKVIAKNARPLITRIYGGTVRGKGDCAFVTGRRDAVLYRHDAVEQFSSFPLMCQKKKCEKVEKRWYIGAVI